MVSIIPVEGGQYRFAYKSEAAGVSHFGIFHSYAAVEASFAVDLYVEALTPANEIPVRHTILITVIFCLHFNECTCTNIPNWI